MLKLFSRHEFETLAKEHHQGQKLRKLNRWTQFVSLSLARLSGRTSLRDIVSNVSAQTSKLYHMGATTVSRSSLARVNAKQPHTLYESLFNKLLSRCQVQAPKHGFRFKNKLYSLDASTIDLCLDVFPWAKFRTTKGAIKLHVGLDHSGYLPTFMTVTDGKVHDVTVGRTLKLPRQSIVVFDKGYNDYDWYNQLNSNDIFFVTRQKTNASYDVIERRTASKNRGITSDQTIRIKGSKANDCPIPLRRIGYKDSETGKHYIFLTNNFKLAATTIANIYKARWQVELFFKWIKQNLKIKTFLGTSKNAVLTQIWIAMCMYLLLAFIKFCHKLNLSLQQILRLLQLNLFERRDLVALLRGDPPIPPDPQLQTRFQFT
jgi:putative transposase